MTQLFMAVLSLSLSGTLLGAVILLLRAVTGKYFSKRWTYYLWLLLIGRLLLPVYVDVNVTDSIFRALPGRTAAQEKAEVMPDSPQNIMGADETGIPEDAFAGSTGQGRSTAVEAPKYADLIWRVTGIGAIVWLAGVVMSALIKTRDYRRFVRGIRQSAMPTADPVLLAQRDECLARLKIRRRVPVYISPQVFSPMLIGFFSSCIILPADMPVGFMEKMPLILHHELMHFKRRDIGYKWLFQLALCIHWFNPFLSYFNRKFHLDCELACDEAVMHALTDEGRRAYGDVLLSMAEKNVSCRRNVLAMTLFEEKGTLKERLNGILRYHKRGAVVALCSAAAVVLLFAIALIGGMASAAGGTEDRFGGKVIILKNDSVKESAGISKRLFGGRGFFGNLTNNFWVALFGGEENFLKQEMHIDYDAAAYHVYDDDELIADKDEQDVWRALVITGDEYDTDAVGMLLNGSDTLAIIYADRDTTVEFHSSFEMQEGRFKFVHVTPDGDVKVLNEDGEVRTETIALPAGRNMFKMVGQEAKIKNLLFMYSETDKRYIDYIFMDEEEEENYFRTENSASEVPDIPPREEWEDVF